EQRHFDSKWNRNDPPWIPFGILKQSKTRCVNTVARVGRRWRASPAPGGATECYAGSPLHEVGGHAIFAWRNLRWASRSEVGRGVARLLYSIRIERSERATPHPSFLRNATFPTFGGEGENRLLLSRQM